ncbi:MAG: dynamin family protein [Phycisphaeraceae bacterium]
MSNQIVGSPSGRTTQRSPSAFDRDALLDWAIKVKDGLPPQQGNEAKEDIDRAITGLKSDRFCLAVLGKAKRGKSTLLNALLGRKDDNVAPVDKLPASSTISRIQWAETEDATVFFRDGRMEKIGFNRIREFVTEEQNKENHKEVDVVEIAGPFQAHQRDVVLVDTPGAGSIHEYHDTLLHAFIPQADAVIFLVTARMPIDQDELDLLKKVKAADIRKVFFAINRVDECDEQDVEDAVNHNLRLLSQAGISVSRIHRISAKAAFNGDIGGSGVGALMSEVSEFLAANKGRVLTERFVARVRAAAEPVLQGMDIQLASSRKSTGELDAEIERLRDKKTSIESEREFAEREFTNAWTRAVGVFESDVKDAKSNVTAQLANEIQKTSSFGVSGLARNLPTVLTRTIEEALNPVSRRFEESARETCDKLQASYPILNVGSAGAVTIKTREGVAAITGTVGGVSVAAAGIGFAAAGAATAATIAAANAAAVATVSTVATPTIASSILSLIGFEGLATAFAAPTTVVTQGAITTTPMWVALAGPIGWTLAGIGVLAVPFSWRLSKLKLKDKIEQAAREQIDKVFGRIESDRLPAVRAMGKSIVEEIRLRLDRQLHQVESALVTARDHRPSESEVRTLADRATRLKQLIGSVPVPGGDSLA